MLKHANFSSAPYNYYIIYELLSIQQDTMGISLLLWDKFGYYITDIRAQLQIWHK